MERAIKEGNFQINNRITSKYAIFRRLSKTLFNRINVFLRNRTADDLVLKNNAATAIARFQGKYNMPILTLTT